MRANAKQSILKRDCHVTTFLAMTMFLRDCPTSTKSRNDRGIMNTYEINKHKNKFILQFSVPSIVAMILSSLITVIDGFFTGNFIGDEGLAAINLGLPIVYIYLAIGLMVGVGGISIAGRLLGSGEMNNANNVFRQTMIFTTIICAVLTIIFFFTIEPISYLFEIDDLTRSLFITYYKVVIFEYPLMIIFSCFGMFIRSEGSPVFVMILNIVAVVLNFVLNALFVQLLGFGIEGIAIASVISSTVTVALCVIYFCKPKVFKFGTFIWKKDDIKEIIFNGGSEFIGEFSMVLSMFAYNFIILKCSGVDGLAAFTIVGYVSYIFSMIIVGFEQGCVPLISFSFGANEKRLARELRNQTMKMTTIVSVFIFVVMTIFANFYSSLFTDSTKVMSMVRFGLVIQMSSFVFIGLDTIASGYFTAIGKAKESAIISFARGFVILLVAIFILPTLFGLNGVWFVSLVTESLTMILSVIFMIKDKENKMIKMKEFVPSEKSLFERENDETLKQVQGDGTFIHYDSLCHSNGNCHSELVSESHYKEMLKQIQHDDFNTRPIEIYGLTQNNLKNIDLKIPKNKIIVFTGVSGSGKSSIVFDTIASESQRQMNETYPPFIRNRLPKYERAKADRIENLCPSVVVDQARLGGNARSTVGTITDLYSTLRILFSRIGEPYIGTASYFSFNDPNGMCPECSGMGKINQIDMTKVIDEEKSLNEDMINFSAFHKDSWYWKQYTKTGFFDLDKKFKDYSEKEKNLLLYGSYTKGGKQVHEKMEGLYNQVNRLLLNRDLSKKSDARQKQLDELLVQTECPCCHGKRLNQNVLRCKIGDYSIADFCEMEFTELRQVLASITDERGKMIVQKMIETLTRLIDIGLPYLNLNRETSTLSGGEAQRLKLVRYMGSSLTDMIYIFDEPSTGLHPRDVHRMSNLLKNLRDKGNTVIVVEHDKDIICIADEIIDVGPKAGINGGKIQFQGSYEDLLKTDTVTGKALSEKVDFKSSPRVPKDFLPIRNATLHNLKNVSVDIPLNALTVVTGVAGSGKSSLIRDVFAKQYADRVVLIDQSPITATNRSTPSSYIGFFDDIRKLIADKNKTDVSYFSFNSKGACPVCKGKGEIYTELVFMDPVVTVCESCSGVRYNEKSLSYKLNGKNIVEILNLSVDEALEFFAGEDKITKHLDALKEVGLGYLSLGQPLSTLSGGERQRIKLAKNIGKKGNVYVLDEPTTGLHTSDIKKIMKLLERFVDKGNTVIVIEHNLDVMKMADYVIDVGPDGGSNGGQIVFVGTPKEMVEKGETITAKWLGRE